jgi:ubiquinone/menaquinone biosynthesis C-methylase UbiE
VSTKNPRAARSLIVLAQLGAGCASAASDHAGPDDAAAAHDHHHDTAHHEFSDVTRWTKEFDDPTRDAWQKPDEIVKLMRISAGMTVADVGAGTGYFERRLDAAVGAQGHVIALDVEPNMVDFMRDRFAKEHLASSEARVCPYDSTGLEPRSVDRVLVVDTWHHIDHRDAYSKHLASILKPGGLVAIVDFTLESDKGPPPAHRLKPETILADLNAAGLDAQLADETLPDQYVVVATLPAP